ncbi:MAG TPA: hypothetical protein VHF22_04780 [Planctomycetota bacterium]|nr:hypothetical protein [Planctomycetota bacterium]
MHAPPTPIEVARAALAGPPELAARFEHARVRPWSDPALAFEALVPKEFAAVVDLERREPPPGEWLKIGSFRAPTGDSLDVTVARPGRDVGLADFFAALAERFSLEVVDVSPLDFGGREAVDALVRWSVGGDGPRVSRLVLFRHGERVARVSGTAHAGRYGGLADAFAASISTFRFLEPQPSFFCEPYEWSSSIGAIPLGFRRPSAWRFEERGDTPWGRQQLDLRLVVEGGPVAWIRARSIDRDVAPEGLDVERLGVETLDDLRAIGFQSAALRQRVAPATPGDPFDEKTFGVIHDGRAFGRGAEARILCLATHRALYSIAAVLPARDADRLAWMGAKRALDVLYQTLNRPDDDVLAAPGARRPRPAPPDVPEPAAPGRDRGAEEE